MRCEYVGNQLEWPYTKRCEEEATKEVELKEPEGSRDEPERMEVCDECAEGIVGTGEAILVG